MSKKWVSTPTLASAVVSRVAEKAIVFLSFLAAWPYGFVLTGRVQADEPAMGPPAEEAGSY
jgi:hypothetical protein